MPRFLMLRWCLIALCTVLLALLYPLLTVTTPSTAQSLVTLTAENVELLGHIGGATLAVDVVGSYAYMGEGPCLTVLNIANPAGPKLVGKTVPLPGIVEDIKVVGTLAYIANGPPGYVLLMCLPQPTLGN